MTTVSVIIPCYNEERTIALLLDALLHQSAPLADMEIVLSDGMSTDGTRRVIAEFGALHPQLIIKVVDNPQRNIPAAINQAIAASSGDVLIRLDAHCIPAADYVQRSLADLQAGLGDNVGGVWQIQPGGPGWVARSIAAAAAHPLGVGDARYRYSTQPGVVDTVPFGAFRRDLLQRLGGFDETLLTNEDYEFNTRIRQSGGTVYFDPRIRSVYFARSSLGALARQYWRYGYWKLRMLLRYPATLRWRQALPPVFVLGVLLLAVAALFWGLAQALLLGGLGVYLLVLLAASIPVALRRKDAALAVGIPMAIVCMHFTWGLGFLVSFVRSWFDQKRKS